MSNEQNKQLTEYAAKLNQLEANIKSNSVLLIEQGKVVLKLAIEAGTILCQAKDLVPHGEWEKWLADNVTGITKRTSEKYMKLARKTNFGSEMKDDWKNLLGAYQATGIVTQTKPKTPVTGGNESPPSGDAAEQDDAQEHATLNEARLLIVQRVRSDIEAAGVNWDVATWSIKNGRPASNDAMNQLALTLSNLKHFILFRQYMDIEREVEMEERIKAALNEFVKAIIKANRPTQPNVSDYAFEMNPAPIETAEAVAA